jgi:hypothetical protein
MVGALWQGVSAMLLILVTIVAGQHHVTIFAPVAANVLMIFACVINYMLVLIVLSRDVQAIALVVVIVLEEFACANLASRELHVKKILYGLCDVLLKEMALQAPVVANEVLRL